MGAGIHLNLENCHDEIRALRGMAVDRAEADARPLRAAGRRFRDRFETGLATVRGGSLFSTARSSRSGKYTANLYISTVYLL